MTYQKTLDYLFAKLPMYQREGGAIAYKADVGNIIEAAKHLNNPHKKFKSIHKVNCIQSMCRRKVKMFLEYVWY